MNILPILDARALELWGGETNYTNSILDTYRIIKCIGFFCIIDPDEF